MYNLVRQNQPKNNKRHINRGKIQYKTVEPKVVEIVKEVIVERPVIKEVIVDRPVEIEVEKKVVVDDLEIAILQAELQEVSDKLENANMIIDDMASLTHEIEDSNHDLRMKNCDLLKRIKSKNEETMEDSFDKIERIIEERRVETPRISKMESPRNVRRRNSSVSASDISKNPVAGIRRRNSTTVANTTPRRPERLVRKSSLSPIMQKKK